MFKRMNGLLIPSVYQVPAQEVHKHHSWRGLHVFKTPCLVAPKHQKRNQFPRTQKVSIYYADRRLRILQKHQQRRDMESDEETTQVQLMWTKHMQPGQPLIISNAQKIRNWNDPGTRMSKRRPTGEREAERYAATRPPMCDSDLPVLVHPNVKIHTYD